MFYAIRRANGDFYAGLSLRGGKVFAQWSSVTDPASEFPSALLFVLMSQVETALASIKEVHAEEFAEWAPEHVKLGMFEDSYYAAANADGDLFSGIGATTGQAMWSSVDAAFNVRLYERWNPDNIQNKDGLSRDKCEKAVRFARLLDE